jgi:hypothetical protein
MNSPNQGESIRVPPFPTVIISHRFTQSANLSSVKKEKAKARAPASFHGFTELTNGRVFRLGDRRPDGSAIPPGGFGAAIVAASPCSDEVSFRAARLCETRSVLFALGSRVRSQSCWFWRSADDLRVR